MNALIIYRNPIEQWWWESDMSNWFILTLVGVLALCFLFFALDSFWRWFKSKW